MEHKERPEGDLEEMMSRAGYCCYTVGDYQEIQIMKLPWAHI